jgi:hypothetical protein
MEPTQSDPRDDPERAAAQAFQSDSGEHAPPAAPAPAIRPDPGPADAYQHEDREPAWPIG